MKKIFILSALISLLTFNSSFTTNNDNDLKVTPIKDSKYENLFQVDLKLPLKDTITIYLIDAEGVELYTERYIGSNYSKKFSLATHKTDMIFPIKIVVISNTSKKMCEYSFTKKEVLIN